MSLQEALAAPGDGPLPDLDLMVCDDEPIHIPGAIQPHGAVIAARIDDGLVTQVSANLAAMIGVAPDTALGCPLRDTLGDAACAALAIGNGVGPRNYQTTIRGIRFNLRSHKAGSLLCVDLEPKSSAVDGMPIVMVQTLLQTFQHATTQPELCELAVRGLKSLTGYDRVMAYRFDETGDGEVIAERCNDGLEPFLGLRYPASDVPRQARQLYLRQRVGVIADSHYQPVPMLSHPKLHDGKPLDMTDCSLRSVSPMHLEYMRNMRTAASLTIGLACHENLWGMLVCHHGTPRIAGADVRAAAEMVGQVVSLLLASLVSYRLTLAIFCIKKSHQIIAGTITAAARRSAAAVAALPALVR